MFSEISVTSQPDSPIQSKVVISSTGLTEIGYKLSLCRFRGFDTLTVNLPSNGIVLLDGRSGVGKTTILEAISFALYDGARNTCYPRADRNSKKKHESTWVRLETPFGLNIYRQRRSNLLQVNSPDVSLTDDSAQAYLNRIFGPISGWLAGGYLRQWDFCAFLTMSSGEKLKFLQEMTIPDQFEQLIELTGKKIIEATQQVQEADVQVRVCQEMYMQLYNTCPDHIKSQTLWQLSDIEECFRSHNLNLPDPIIPIIDQLKILSQGTDERERDEMNQLQSKLSQEQIKIARQSEGYRQRAQLEARLDQLHQDLMIIPSSEIKIDELEKEISELSEQILLARKSERRTQLLAAKSEIQRRISLISEVTPKFTRSELDQIERVLSGHSLEKIDQELSEIQLAQTYQQCLEKYQRNLAQDRQRQSLQEQIQKLEDQLRNCPTESYSDEIDAITQKIWSLSLRQRQLSCPRCGTNVYLHEGHLEEIPSVSDAETKDISELQTKKLKLQQQERLFQQRANLESSLQALKSQLEQMEPVTPIELPNKPKYGDCTAGQLDFKLSQLQAQRKQRLEIPEIDVEEERKRLSQHFERARLLSDMQHINGELNNLSDTHVSAEVNVLEKLKDEKLKQIQEQRNQELRRSQLQANKQQLQEQLQALPECPPNETSLQEIQTQIETCRQKYILLKDKISAQIQLVQMAELYVNHTQKQQIKDMAMQRAGAFQKIRATLITAEYVILDTVLGQINITLAEVLGLLFTEPISVTLRSLRHLKSNDRIKPEINIEICYKGAEFSNLNELSGGEKSRVSLALVISFARLCRAPFMLLDESLSSLDVTTKEYAINAIKRYLDDKLVIAVNHDTTEGVYDAVIRLD